ncbi:hypothetical protein [Streptomyces tailanensis]|uniref:hypothetical protein n=1 Tax=Streptomyces tailanensis TaxID=2569858 RepID=UPI001FEBCF60|nr:hypothetical protein [Streptomyces tailanensis]
MTRRCRAPWTATTSSSPPPCGERLRKLNDLRKDEEIWEYERQHERNKRRYLGDDVLKSAGSAVVWWLARHENEIEKAVDMIGPLAQIAAAANDEEVPELFRHLLVPPVDARSEATIGGPLWRGDGPGGGTFDREEEVEVSDRLLLLLAALGLKPDMDEYAVFVHRVVRSLEAAGLDEAAEEIRRTLLPTPDARRGRGRGAGGWAFVRGGHHGALVAALPSPRGLAVHRRGRGPGCRCGRGHVHAGGGGERRRRTEPRLAGDERRRYDTSVLLGHLAQPTPARRTSRTGRGRRGRELIR